MLRNVKKSRKRVRSKKKKKVEPCEGRRVKNHTGSEIARYLEITLRNVKKSRKRLRSQKKENVKPCEGSGVKD